MFFVYLLLWGLALASSSSSSSGYSGHADSFFQSDELPTLQNIYFSGADANGITVPIHFGGVGTFAYESFLISGHGIYWSSGSFAVFDCFCAGDQFRLHMTNTLTGEVFTLDTSGDPVSLDCATYAEDLSVCYNSSSYGYAIYKYEEAPPALGPFNLTIEVTQSPYGGGIAYFQMVTKDIIPPS